MEELINENEFLQIIVVLLICAAGVWAFFYGQPLDINDSRDFRKRSKQVKQIYPGSKGKDDQKQGGQRL